MALLRQSGSGSSGKQAMLPSQWKQLFRESVVLEGEGNLVCGKGCQCFSGNSLNVSWLDCGSLCSFRVAGKEKEIASLQSELASQRNAFEQQRKKNNVRKFFPHHPRKAPKTTKAVFPALPEAWGILQRAFLTAVCCTVSLGTPFLQGVTQHTQLHCSELCQLLDNFPIEWEERDLLGDTSHSKFLELDSNLV